MKIYDCKTKELLTYTVLKDLPENEILIISHAHEAVMLKDYYGFDNSTIEECVNFDDNVRFDSFREYDFTSFLHFVYEKPNIRHQEINLFVGKTYVVLVVHEENDVTRQIEQEMIDKIVQFKYDNNCLNKIYYTIFDCYIRDLIGTLEEMEDEIERIESNIFKGVNPHYLEDIIQMKTNVYAAIKAVRPLLHISDVFIMNDNQIILSSNMRYFKTIQSRIRNLYDFSEQLQEYTNQTLYTYDSKMTTQTNEVVNKLAVITLLFAPLTLITGIYGMNFVNIPETQHPYGYFWVVLAMILIEVVLYLFVKRKKWL